MHGAPLLQQIAEAGVATDGLIATGLVRAVGSLFGKITAVDNEIAKRWRTIVGKQRSGYPAAR